VCNPASLAGYKSYPLKTSSGVLPLIIPRQLDANVIVAPALSVLKIPPPWEMAAFSITDEEPARVSDPAL
jgi:hypothetical protein